MSTTDAAATTSGAAAAPAADAAAGSSTAAAAAAPSSGGGAPAPAPATSARGNACAVCATPLPRFSNAWWISKRCGRCKQLVCSGCTERPVVVTDQANVVGIKNVCKPCYAVQVGETFARDVDVYEFSGAPEADVPAAIRGTTVVLLHGATAGKESLRSIATALSRHFRVVVPDLPRHGSQLAVPMTAESCVDTVRRAIEAHVPDKVALVVGASLGGQVAMAFAAKHPELCVGVVAVACCNDPTDAAMEADAAKMKKQVHMLDSKPVIRMRLAYVSLRAMFKLSQNEATEVMRNGLYYECWDEYWDMLCTQDFLADVRNTEAPIFIVAPAADKHNCKHRDRFQAAVESNQRSPASGFLVVEGNHVWFMVQPEEVVEIVRTFGNALLLPQPTSDALPANALESNSAAMESL